MFLFSPSISLRNKKAPAVRGEKEQARRTTGAWGADFYIILRLGSLQPENVKPILSWDLKLQSDSQFIRIITNGIRILQVDDIPVARVSIIPLCNRRECIAPGDYMGRC